MKRTFLLLMLICSIFFGYTKVNAFSINQKYDNTVTIDYLDEKESSVSCDGLLTQEGLDMIKEILGWVRIIAPIILILLVALDLASAVMSQDNDLIGKAAKKIVPRLIGTALLFFVPTIVRAILDIDGVRDSIVIPDDPLCHTMASLHLDNNYDYFI